MSFKVTIINNENGDVLVHEENADVIIGSIHAGEGNRAMGFTAANAFAICESIRAAEAVSTELQQRNPELGMLLQFMDLMSDKKKKEEDGDETV